MDLWFALNCRLEKIDPVAQLFEVNAWLNFFWVDKDLNTKPEYHVIERGITLDDNGENQPINIHSLFENSISYEILGDPMYRFNKNTGVVSETIHFKASLSEELELERFPFDRQYLTLRMCVRTKEFHCLSEPPPYVPNRLNMRSMASFTCSPSIAGWTPFSPVVGHCNAAGQSDDLRITVSLRVERQYAYWLSNLLFAVFLIVGLAPVGLAISPDAIAERMGIILTLLLTLVTFKFIIASEVPKTSTMTLLDKYIVVGYFMLLFVVGQTLWCLTIDEESWASVNKVCGFGMLIFWVVFHVWILRCAFNSTFCIPWDQMKDEGASTAKSMLVEAIHIDLPPKDWERVWAEKAALAAKKT